MDKNTIPSLHTSPEGAYIKASFKYTIIVEEGNILVIKNSKIPGFSYKQKDINKELSFSEYKNYLYAWIREKQNSHNPDDRFIPIVDRINLNETRIIEAYDPTKEQNEEKNRDLLTNLKNKEMYSINHIKPGSLNATPKKEK